MKENRNFYYTWLRATKLLSPLGELIRISPLLQHIEDMTIRMVESPILGVSCVYLLPPWLYLCFLGWT